ncbi:MAG: hypothetical protein LBV75_03460 [Paludibacter sp.]|jgi:hypothetical protein|nr:hypothetical protein [Paludibacter sp.]
MNTQKENAEFVEKVVRGLDVTYEKLIAEKRAQNEEIIVLRNNKIMAIKP